MLKDIVTKYYFDNNYNCAESLVRAGNEYFGLDLHDRDMILVSAYGGGIQTGDTCGALLGAVAVLSMKYVETRAHMSADIKPVVTMLVSRFNEKYQSNLCVGVKPQAFREGVRCLSAVETACDILEEVIAEYEANKGK